MSRTPKTDTIPHEGLWRYYASEIVFIKSKRAPDNEIMEHIVIPITLGFINWYFPGRWDYNNVFLKEFPLCDFAGSSFLEELVTAGEARRYGSTGRIQSAATSIEDRSILCQMGEKIRG